MVINITDMIAAKNGEHPMYINGMYSITTTVNVNTKEIIEMMPFRPPTSHINP